MHIPPDTLCPTVTSRLNYLLWIRDVISKTNDDTIIGLDIGTGATCIYPLLGCRLFLQARFICTEIDPESIKHASENIARNGLDGRISLVPGEPGMVFPDALWAENGRSTGGPTDFCMCNPPFYDSHDHFERNTSAKGGAPSSTLTATNSEMITEGGEKAFIKQMLLESLSLESKIRWYTSLCGHLSTVQYIIGEIKRMKISNYLVAEFAQGRTIRWGVAWSFEKQRPPPEAYELVSKSLAKIAPNRGVQRSNQSNKAHKASSDQKQAD